MTEEVKEKYCRKCDTAHPIDNFHKNALTKDGLHTYCKGCRKEDMKPYMKQYHKDNYIPRHGKRGRKKKERENE